MRPVIALVTSTLDLLDAGGHLWVYLNWALGLEALGCDVLLVEQLSRGRCGEPRLPALVETLQERIQPWVRGERLRLHPAPGETLSPGLDGLALEGESRPDLMLDFAGKASPSLLAAARRTALVDIDPGIFQLWIHGAGGALLEHDAYFTIGETVGSPGAPFPDLGVEWTHVAPPVHLPAWPVLPALAGAPFTTVSSWWGWWEVQEGETWNNEKREAFMRVLELPSRTEARLELALALWEHQDHPDVVLLKSRGWKVRHATSVARSPASYQAYVRASRGEFSCAKPSCARLQNAWISDRTLAYLATGRPAVVEHSGRSRILPERDGLLRFRGVEDAARCLDEVERDYERHASAARALVEEHFDARLVLGRVLERVLP